MNRPTVKVFLPTAALKNETCLLLGRKNKQHNTCCVTNYLLIQDLSVTELEKVVSCDIEVIGILINESAGYDPETLDSCQTYLRTLPEWIIMKRSDGDLPVCTVYGKWQDYNLRTHVIVLLFSAEDVHASYLLESESPNTNLGQLYSGWQHGITFQKSCEDRNINVIKGFVSKDTGWTSEFSVAIRRHLSRLCLLFTSLITWISNRSIFTCSSICRYIPRPAVFCQLEYKSRKLHNSIIQQHHSRVDEIRLTGVLWQQILDVILGVTVMLCVRCHSETIGSAIMQSAEVVAAELEQLLKWMMGVPAGLKLNKELTNFLGQFFMYHIYLWKGYLWFLYPLWADAVWCISLSGCLGLSTQLSLIQDLLSVMTLHCYCFYVYAARLYSLQVYALRSLWRLFRGKKWNPLFQRVDSSSYDVDQLFIGTLLFTILLFLLPTTGLYYAVFTGLRLLVLAIQGSLYKLVAIIDYLSLYALYLKVITPNKIVADVQLHVHTRNSHQPLFHTIQLHPTSLSKLFCLINSPSSSKVEDTWKVFLTKLITGKLIYPWIE